MIAVVVLALAGIGLVGWLVPALGRLAFEPRIPRPAVILRLARSGLRRGRSPGNAEQAELGEQPDVELAVRERLYGSRPRAR